MTITQDPSAPLIAVVGATGNQGGSVVRALADSTKSYRVRGFTRDSTKPAAQELVKLGVEVIAVSLVVENKEAVYRVFEAATYAFLVTNFWEHVDMDKEVAEGKLLIDAAKAAGASGIIWSGLPSFIKHTNGKYTHVYHFEGKSLITAYGRHSGVPFVDVQAGSYASNFRGFPFAPTKQADGSYVLGLPTKPTTSAPIVDIPRDYGKFVRYALELEVFPDGQEFAAYSENISIEKILEQWGQATGKKFKYVQISRERFKQQLEAAGLPPHIVDDEMDLTAAFDEFGWPVPPIPEALKSQVHTWADYAKKTDWTDFFAGTK
ncbi:NmrA domain-containing protein [Favolaschia claudopus]|uniref:NmrA domain-containing protein n=1 Tax=Favolaschia claudopus TaxID=2862362 RepID=A0AAW0D1J4_9AGAR